MPWGLGLRVWGFDSNRLGLGVLDSLTLATRAIQDRSVQVGRQRKQKTLSRDLALAYIRLVKLCTGSGLKLDFGFGGRVLGLKGCIIEGLGFGLDTIGALINRIG